MLSLLSQLCCQFVSHLKVMINKLDIIVIFKCINKSENFLSRFQIKFFCVVWDPFQPGFFWLNTKCIKFPVNAAEVFLCAGNSNHIPVYIEVFCTGINHFKFNIFKR